MNCKNEFKNKLCFFAYMFIDNLTNVDFVFRVCRHCRCNVRLTNKTTNADRIYKPFCIVVRGCYLFITIWVELGVAIRHNCIVPQGISYSCFQSLTDRRNYRQDVCLSRCCTPWVVHAEHRPHVRSCRDGIGVCAYICHGDGETQAPAYIVYPGECGPWETTRT